MTSKLIASTDKIVTDFLRAIGAPDNITEVHVWCAVGKPVRIECIFFASLNIPDGEDALPKTTKTYRLTEIDDNA